MAYSTQRAVSDGTMTYLDVSIGYQARADLSVLFDGTLAPDGSWAWVGTTDKRIAFTSTVPNGVEVMLVRNTNLGYVNNSFVGGAKFNNATMDSNFLQMLYIAQEAKEGSSLSDLYADLDVHGFRIKNVGNPVADSDAISKGYLTAQLPSFTAAVDAANAAATSATASASSASASATAATASKNAAATSETNAGNSATTAGNAATTAQGYRDQAQTAQNAAAASASAAATSKTNADNSAAAAATSETNAATSESQAEFYAGQAAASSGQLPVLNAMWFFSRSAIPAGYVPLDGGTFSRTTYPDAWAAINGGNVPVVSDASWIASPANRGSFTAGDGSTTFRVPDMNGKFDAASFGALFTRGDGLNSAGVAGVIQRDALQNLTGKLTGLAVSSNVTGSGVFSRLNTTGPVTLASASTFAMYDVDFDASRIARTAIETRSVNLTGVWAVKLTGGLAINPGAIDVGMLATDMGNMQTQVNRIDSGDIIGTRAVNLALRASDAPLNVGQTGYVDISAAASTPLHVSLASGQRYRWTWNSTIQDGSTLGGGIGFLPNGTPAVANTMYIHGLMNAASTNAYGPAGQVLSSAQVPSCSGVLYTDTKRKFIQAIGSYYAGGWATFNLAALWCVASAGNSSEQATAWESLGNFMCYSGTLTGRFTLTRDM